MQSNARTGASDTTKMQILNSERPVPEGFKNMLAITSNENSLHVTQKETQRSSQGCFELHEKIRSG